MAGEQDMVERGDRPSRHGKLLGEALAAIADAGRAHHDLQMCATCAFREGSMPNQCAGTGLIALNTMLGIDSDDFACHHGMENGQPTKICAGYLMAKAAPWNTIVAEIETVKARLDNVSGPDETRQAYDAWLEKVDPARIMDVYQLGRLWARRVALASHDKPDEAEGGT